MPVASLVRPILLTSSIVIGASVALYETNPHIRHLVDTAALKISNVFQDILSAIDEGLRNLTPEQREEHRRRQREHVAMVAMSGRGNDAGTETAVALRRNGPSLHRDTSSRNRPALTREALDINTTAQEGASAVSGREELRAKRRRLWELAQAPPPVVPTNDSAVEIAPLLPERPKDDEPTTQEPPQEQASQAREPSQDEAAATTVLFEHETSNEAARPNNDEDDVVTVSSDGSHSLIPTPQYSPSLSATSWSQPPSPAPEDLVDALSSTDEDDGASTDTETMSHVSGYSFGSNAQSGFGENDVISLASSDAGDLERER